VKSSIGKCVIGLIPLLPARIFSHDFSTVTPTGETIPRPVTTTILLDIKKPHTDYNKEKPPDQPIDHERFSEIIEI
jgi:hypothetical protein